MLLLDINCFVTYAITLLQLTPNAPPSPSPRVNIAVVEIVKTGSLLAAGSGLALAPGIAPLETAEVAMEEAEAVAVAGTMKRRLRPPESPRGKGGEWKGCLPCCM